MVFFSKTPSVKVGLFPMCFVSDSIPGQKIKRSLGLIKATTAGISGSYNSEEELVTTKLWEEAEKLGADAVINFRYETGSYQKNGAGWVTSYLIAYGEAVIFEV